jgi:tetratricopeptide (TPR) repeat protein
VAQAIARRTLPDASLALEQAFWLSLDGVRSLERLRGDLAMEVGIDLEQGRDDEALARGIGARRALAVIDNAEDLLRADRGGLRRLLSTLLERCPGIRLLVTSREELGDAREEFVRLEKLSGRDARAVFVGVAGPRLFDEEKSAPELATILAWLDGHPLSLVLVARQTGTVPIATLWKHIQDREADAIVETALLEEEMDAGSDAKLRTMRLASSLNLSYRPLLESPRLRGAAEMFAWLGHFDAGLPGALVPLVFGEEGEEHRATLLRRCMLEEQGRERRLALPVPVRAYARKKAERLLEVRRLELLERSFGAMGKWLSAHRARLGTPGSRAAMSTGVREGANLSSLLLAMDTVGRVDRPQADRIAQGLETAIEAFATLSSYAGSAAVALDVVERALRVSTRLGSLRSIASAWQALGDLYVRTDRLKEADVAYQPALAIHRAIDDRLGEANTLKVLGDLYVRTDRLKEAEETYQQVLATYRVMDAIGGEAHTQTALGALYVRTDRLKEAEAAYRQALATCRAIDDRLGEANTLKALGALYLRTDSLHEAEVAYQQALAIYSVIDDRRGEANAHRALGDVYLRTARLNEAEAAYNRALPICRAIDDRHGEANTQRAMGDLYVRTDRLKEAEVAYQEALATYRAIDARLGEANAQYSLGDLYVRTDRLDEAQAAYQQALATYRAINARLGEANTQGAMGDLYVRTDRLKEAEAAYQEALAIHRAVDNRLGEANTLKALGDLYMRTNLLKEAEAIYQQALATYCAIDARPGEANTQTALGDLYARIDRFEEAEAAYRRALPIHRAIDDRLGEANAQKGLGALFVRTDRLKEAELAYQQALASYRAIDDRLEEANVLGDLGTIALAHSNPRSAFERYLESLLLRRQIGEDLGVAAAHGYLARAALVAGQPLRAAVLIRPAILSFAGLDHHSNLILLLPIAAGALASMGKDEASTSAWLLAWSHARAIGNPLAERLAEFAGLVEPPPEDLSRALPLLNAALDACEHELHERGEDPYSPLPAPVAEDKQP